MQYDEILDFWFNEIPSKNWWIKDIEFDKAITNRFGEVHSKAARAELFSWRTSPQGRLAEVIVLDQFSRNIYRDRAEAFAQDALALALAQEAVHQGDDAALAQQQRSFLYMPYMHSESLEIHNEAVRLFEALDKPGQLEYEIKHRDIIEKFGRYPHRNKLLGRDSTPEEIAFLEHPGSSF